MGEEVVEFCGGGSGRGAGGVDVGNAVAVGVVFTGGGGVGEICAEAIGGAEAGALAEEHEGEVGIEEASDFVLDGNAAVTDYYQGGEKPGGGADEGQEGGEKGLDLEIGGAGGEAV